MPPTSKNATLKVTKKVATELKDAANGKRSADASPEGMPHQKRSVFRDLTNATKKDSTEVSKEGSEEKRIPRSRSGFPCTGKQNENPTQQLESQSIRKSKRLSDKKENAIKCLVGLKNGESAVESHETSYETADESPCFTSGTLLSAADETSALSSIERKLINSIPPNKTDLRLLPVVPEGVYDFDAETAMDPFSASLYAQDIFEHFKKREVQFLADKYLKRQTDISRGMRSILVDWMAEVQESFELNHESLYLAVKLVDLYLSRQIISKNALQLLGSTAMLVAAKFDERSPPVVDDFLYICDDAYDRSQLLRMEIKLLKTVDFDLGIPLSYSFLRRYARCSKQTMELLTLARYILELSLLEYEMVDIPDSLIAAASLSLALQMRKMNPWSATLEHFSGYCLPELTDLIHRLNSMLMTVGHRNLQTIPNKYSHKVFFEVAKIPPLEILST